MIFVAQWDAALGATNYSWFNAANWWASDGAGNLVQAGRVPTASEGAIVTGFVDAFASAVRVQEIVLTNGATATNGTFAAERLLLQSGSTFQDAKVNVLSRLQVGGTNCTLENTTLSVLSTGEGRLSPVPPATQATLWLDRGSMFWVGARLNLADGSQINTHGPLTDKLNTLAVAAGAILTATNTTRIQGSGSAVTPLVIDNSGLIQSQGGTLVFDEAIEWRSSAGVGEFRAVDVNAQLLFSSPMQVPAGVISRFTGPGMSRFQAGATIDGQAQVGVADSASQFFMAGNLVIDDSVGGSGTLRTLGATNGGSVLRWNNGILNLSGVNVDAGAEMDFAGDPGTSRVLSGCAITNLGLCALVSPGVGMVQGASIHNEPGGVFEVRADGTFSGTTMPGGGEFDNGGVFRKTTTGITSFGDVGSAAGPEFNNTGLVDLQSGGLNLCGGTSSGQFRTGGDGSLWFWGGTHALNAGSAFTGAGPVRLLQGASAPAWHVSGSVSAERLELGPNGTVVGFGKTSPAPIRIGRLLASDNGVLTNGSFEMRDVELRDQVVVADSTLTVSDTLGLAGTNCALSASALNVAAGATGQMSRDAEGRRARLELRQGATIDIAGQLSISDGALISGGGLPQNRVVIRPGGTLAATNAATVRGSATGPLAFDNSGVVHVDSGTLTFEEGIQWQSSGGLARFHAATEPAVVHFASPLEVPASMTCVFTGPGTNRLAGGGVIAGTAQVGFSGQGSPTPVPGNLEINDDLSGAGALHVLGGAVQGGGVYWNNGTLSLALLVVEAGGRAVIGGDSTAVHQLAACTINTAGFLTWAGQPVTAGAGAVINVLSGGMLDLQGDPIVMFSGIGSHLWIRNWGTFMKSAGTGSSVIAADVANSGRFEIRTGSLEVQGALIQNPGSTIVQTGAVLAAPTFTVLSGTVSGGGIINAVLDNAGIIAPGTPLGILSLSPGRDLHQAPSGVLQVEFGGTEPGVQADELVVGGAAQLSGTLDVRLINGFIPQVGQRLMVLTAGSLTGAFTATIGTPPAGTVWVPRYSTTNVTIGLAEPLKVAGASGGPGEFALSIGTTAGFNYVVEASETLSPPDWRTVSTVTGDGLTKNLKYASDRPRSFYRVQIQ